MYWIGDDHHKESAYMTSLDAQGQLYCKKRLSASPESLRAFFGLHPKPFTVGIEACYGWEYVADIIEEMGQTVRVGNPQLLKAHARKHKKNDKVDSALLADRLFHDDFPAIVHPPKDARQLRDLYRQRMDLVRRRTSAACRAKAQADRLGFQATMSLSTLAGIAQFRDLPVAGRYRHLFDSHARLLTYLREEILRMEEVIDEVALETPETRRIETVPGIGHYLALLIWAEVFDASRFCNASAFAGCRASELTAGRRRGRRTAGGSAWAITCRRR